MQQLDLNNNQAKILLVGIIPYFKENNQKLFEEITSSIKQKQYSNRLQNNLTLQTKYYNVNISIFCYSYKDILEDEEDEIENPCEDFIKNLKENLKQIDALIFINKIKSQDKIDGLQQYEQIVDKFVDSFNPQLQTVLFDVKNEEHINDAEIQKSFEKVQSFVEPLYDDFQELSIKDDIVKQKSKSLYEDTEGITRLIEAMESTMWSGYTACVPQKQNLPTKQQEEILENYQQYDQQLEKIQEKDEESQAEQTISNTENQQDQQEQNQNQQNQQQNLDLEQQQNQEQQKIQKIEDKQQENPNINKKQNEEQKEEVQKKVQNTQVQSNKDESNKTQKQEKQQNQTKKDEDIIDDNENEPDISNFTSLLGQMASMRENLQNLPDEERKAQASKIIMSLMNECKFDEEELEEERNDALKLEEIEKKQEKEVTQEKQQKIEKKSENKNQKKSDSKNTFKGMKKGFLN